MQGIVNCLATCLTDDSDNKDRETTRGHWLEHHEHSFCLLGGDMETAAQSRGPTAMAGDHCWSATNANLTHSCCDVHECGLVP